MSSDNPAATNGDQQTAGQSNAQGSASHASSSDALLCQWENCNERYPDANSIYDHLCEKHIGRKSTNNLNLTCKWGTCRTSTVKRDHITSHMRVHVPLKPHKCDFCGKSFKRPQDLKKHVKTHADDSVLMRSPDQSRGGGPNNGPAGGYTNGNRVPGDLQSLAATASGYYPGPEMGPNGSYGNSAQGPGNSAYYAGGAQGSAYGQVYYQVNQASNSSAEQYEVRRRATLDALNEFFGDARGGKINPRTYQDVGQRLGGLQTLDLPVAGGFNGSGMSGFHSGGTLAAAHTGHGPATQEYSLPLSNVRTKGDLQTIDQFLEQLQATVYENESQAAAAGVAQPGSHYVHSGLSYRTNVTPPGTSIPSTSHTAPMTTAPNIETPALTPASSVASYTAGQSPGSVHSAHSEHAISPASRHAAASSMYPTLPSVSAMSDVTSTYATSTGGTPASALGSSFDPDGRRRWTGGFLQKAAPPQSSDAMDISPDGSRRGSVEGEKLRKTVDSMSLRSPSIDPNIDPSLESTSDAQVKNEEQEEDPDKTPEPSSPADTAQANWIDNIRTIEHLRGFIKYRLEQGQFEGTDGEESAGPSGSEESSKIKSESHDDANLYPILREALDRET